MAVRVPGVIVPDIDEVEWDDEVDIICVGTGSAALAVAVAADADGLDVLLTDGRGVGDAETLAGRLGLTDESAEYLDCVTEDTGPLAHATAPAELTVRLTGEPLWPDLGAGVSFSGAALRDWAAACLASPYGLLCTTVADVDAAAVRVGTIDTGEPVDIGGWLRERARDLGITPASRPRWADWYSPRSGRRSRHRHPGRPVPGPRHRGRRRPHRRGHAASAPGARLFRGLAGTVDLVVLPRPFSRFARLGLLVSGRDD